MRSQFRLRLAPSLSQSPGFSHLRCVLKERLDVAPVFDHQRLTLPPRPLDGLGRAFIDVRDAGYIGRIHVPNLRHLTVFPILIFTLSHLI